MVSHWSLSDYKSPQVSRTLFSILADFNNAVLWVVSTRPVVSWSSSPYNNHLITVPRASITIGIIVTFTCHSFFNPLARSRYLSLCSNSFNFSKGDSKVHNSTSFLSFFVDKRIYLTHRWDTNRYYHTGSGLFYANGSENRVHCTFI